MPDGVAQGKADDHHVNGVVDQQEKSALKNGIKMFEVLLPSSMFVPKWFKIYHHLSISNLFILHS